MKKIAVFASGRGTNLQAMIDATVKGRLKAEIALVVSDQKKAQALVRAEKAGIKTLYLDPRSFEKRRDFEAELVRALRKEKVELVVLAGFMKILTPFFVKKYKNRILNIHPALLPAFPGDCAIQDAWQYGVKTTGVTVHIVDEEVDHGPILAQEALDIGQSESLEELEQRIHRIEHKMYPEVVGKVLSGRLTVKGRRAFLR